jgi:uncharacterized protein YcfL
MNRLSLIAVLGSALLLGACATQKTSSPLIEYRGGDLKNVIVVQKTATETAPSGLPQAKAILANKAGVTQKFEYKFVWFDASEMPIDEADRPWHATSVSGRDHVTVSATAPSDKAKTFQIQIRKPEEVSK